MSVNTLVKDGLLTNINVPVHIARVKTGKDVDYNPGLCRDPKGNTWISIRSCTTNLEKWKGLAHPMKYQNYLYVGLLNEENFKITDLKEILPEADYDESLFEFDESIRDMFRLSEHGIIVLIETFSGKRNYYAYADSKKNVTEIVASLEHAYPQENLSWTIHSDPEWGFIAKYSKEFLNG